ncbi:MAG TPA: hypothetical protein VFO91_15920 [Anaerolineales bacterium]|nr:hypothetical protein [Anaerolineales bacterium]
MPDYAIDHLPEFMIILAVLVIFVRQIRRKSLVYTFLTNAGVLSGSAKSSLRILYNGKRIPQARLVEIRIKNTGSLPIEPKDYVEPLSVRLRDSKILSGEVKDPHSAGAPLEPEVFDPSRVVVGRTPLNPKEFVDVKMLVTDGDADLSVSGKITGVKRIENRTDREASYDILLSLVFITLLAMIARFFELLDRSFLMVLQIFTLLVGIWMRPNIWAESQEE